MTKKLKKSVPVEHCWNTRGVWSRAVEKCGQLEEYIHCRNCPIFSREGKRVLNRVPPPGYLKEWTNSLSLKKQVQKLDTSAVLVFRIRDEWFAMPSRCLHEIAEKRTIHRIPRNTNNDVAGVVNIGGEVRVCYSLESILAVKRDIEWENKDDDLGVERLIVVLLGRHYYVFCVNQVSGLCWYRNDEVSPVPATLGCGSENMLSGIIKHNKNKIAVLDADKLQSNLERIQL